MGFKRFRIIFLAVFFLGLVGVGGVSAQSLPTDKLLKYSLDSLRSGMDDAVQKNQKLSVKNSSINNRILFIKKQKRELDARFLKSKEDAIAIKNKIKLEAQELQIEQKRLNAGLERKRQLGFERDTLQKQIETLVSQRKMVKEDVQTKTFDIKELEADLATPSPSNLLDYYGEEKQRLSEQIKECRQQINDLRDKIDHWGMRHSDRLRDQEAALRKKESLEHEVSDWGLRLKEEQAREGLLRKTSEQWAGVTKNGNTGLRKENEGRRNYVRILKKTIGDAQATSANIDQESEYTMKDMQRYLSLLQEENDDLFRYQEMIEAGQELTKKKESHAHASLLLEDRNNGKKKTKDLLEDQISQLQNHIVKQEKINESLARNGQRRQKNLEALSAQLDKEKRKVAVFRKDAFGKKRAEVEKALKEAQSRMKDLDQGIKKAQTTLKDNKDRLAAGQQHQKELKDALSQKEAAMKKVESLGTQLAKEQQKYSRLAKEITENFKQGIQADEMKKKALAASLDVVHQKYQAGGDEMAKFESDQLDLKHYLDILGKENIGLKERLLYLSQQKKEESPAPPPPPKEKSSDLSTPQKDGASVPPPPPKEKSPDPLPPKKEKAPASSPPPKEESPDLSPQK